MRYEAILFDLDGTLLPMDNDEFTKGYFKLLAKVAVGCGYDGEAFLAAMWRGVSAMVKNDGTCLNEKRFWENTAGTLGERILKDIPIFDAFYNHEFHQAKAFTGPNPLAKRAIQLAREKAGKVVLATNPLFPTNAVHARLSWIELKPELFDWITDYTNSCTCKPNPMYYEEICKKLSLDPKKCLMVGNNAQEDMEAAAAVGMPGFLVTDWLISNGTPLDCPQGSFEELISFLAS